MPATKAKKTRKSSGPKKSVYQIVSDRIIEALENGVAPWRKPWGGESAAPRNAKSKKPYRGINAFLLEMEAHARGLESPYWLTYKQAQELGGNVRKGEKSVVVVFWTKWEPKDQPEDEVKKQIPVLRYYRVFHASQCEDLPAEYYAAPGAPENDFDPIERAEAVVDGFKDRPSIDHGGSRACYRPSSDEVMMPEAKRFDGAEEYYSTLFHELTHSTGHKSRIGRPEITQPHRFGSEPYGREELVAEMGAAFLMGHCGIEAKTIDNSAAYLGSWLRAIKKDAKLVIQAAAAAQKAADWILGVTWE